MTLGEKIKQERKKRSLTQEELAEIMYVTPQAISKWERDIGYPDITQIVPLADAFGVSTDVLLNHEDGKQKIDIEEYCQRDKELCHKGIVEERVYLWREATQKYPRDFQCLCNLAESLWSSIISGSCFDDHREVYAKEAIAICERIVKECTDNSIRSSALQTLVYTYSIGYLECADEKKAVEYAEMADGLYTCREILLENAYFTKEGQKEAKSQKQHNNAQFVDMLTRNIAFNGYDNEKDRIFAYETVLKIWNSLFYDGNFLFYHCRVSDIHRYLSRSYAQERNKEKTIENLKQAYYHSNKYDTMPELEKFTSIFFSALNSGSSMITKNYTQTHTQLLLKSLDDSCYDFIRDDEEFKALLNK